MTMPPEPAAPPAPPAQPPAAPTLQAPQGQPQAPAPQAPPVQPPAPPQPPAAPPVPTPPTWSPPPPPPEPGDDSELAKLPQWAQKELTKARQEAAKYRTSARSETVLRHAYATAAQHEVNGDALLGSTAFTTAAAQLDPSAEDFPAKLAAAIQAAKAANPWMAVTPAAPAAPAAPTPPPRGSGQFDGAPGQGQPITAEQLAQMPPEQIAEAMQAGKLAHLL